MRELRYFHVFLIGFSMVFLGTLFLQNNFINDASTGYKNSEYDKSEEIRPSGYYNLSPIFIDDTAPYDSGSITWATAVSQPWCSGTGIKNDPYIIDNIYINGNGQKGIYIRDSTAFFEIKNSYLYNGSLGIYLLFADNAKIENNTFLNNGNEIQFSDNCQIINNTITKINQDFYGIHSLWSYNITIKDNKIFSIKDNKKFSAGDSGISTQNSYNGTYSNNLISGNNDRGIEISSGHDSVISYNNASNNYGRGISVGGDRLEVNNNLAENNGDGISISSNIANIFNNLAMNNGEHGIIVGGNNITLKNNTSTHNGLNGFYLSSVVNSSITNNTIIDNRKWGIYLLSGSKNNIFKNNSLENSGYAFTMYSNLNDISSHSIDKTNKLNGRFIYYFTNQLGLSASNFTNSGQTILINCNNSIVSNSNSISLYSSNNNTISNNQNVRDNRYGIQVKDSTDNIIINNTIYSTLHGINIDNSDRNNINKNIIKDSTEFGMFFTRSKNNTISNNSFIDCGVHIESDAIVGSYEDLTSQIFDNNNRVNGGYLYYYINQIGLTPDNFSNAGQIILINCNKSQIGNLNASISIYHSNNISITDNNIFHNFKYGIFLDASNIINITNNVITNVNWGMFIIGRGSNKVVVNLINNSISNVNIGIILSSSDSSKVINNSLQNMLGTSWREYHYASEHGQGLILTSSINSILANNLIKNGTSNGFNIDKSDFNNVTYNHIEKNDYGINLDSTSNDNLIFGNIFTSNRINAYNKGSNNKWNNTIIGNYWDDYTGVDANDDGIGDTSYLFDGGTDYLPIWDDGNEEESNGDNGDNVPNGIYGYSLPILLSAILFCSVIFLRKLRKFKE